MRYHWRAIYDDGSILNELKSDSAFKNDFKDIDRERLRQFQLLRPDGVPHVVVNLRPGKKLIYIMRSFIRTHLISGKGTEEEYKALLKKLKPARETIWLVGWHENRGGVNIQMIAVVFENGSIEIIDRWRDDYAPYCAPSDASLRFFGIEPEERP